MVLRFRSIESGTCRGDQRAIFICLSIIYYIHSIFSLVWQNLQALKSKYRTIVQTFLANIVSSLYALCTLSPPPCEKNKPRTTCTISSCPAHQSSPLSYVSAGGSVCTFSRLSCSPMIAIFSFSIGRSGCTFPPQ